MMALSLLGSLVVTVPGLRGPSEYERLAVGGPCVAA
jgi:hypothetical protein